MRNTANFTELAGDRSQSERSPWLEESKSRLVKAKRLGKRLIFCCRAPRLPQLNSTKISYRRPLSLSRPVFNGLMR
jgi:hypothetical protein